MEKKEIKLKLDYEEIDLIKWSLAYSNNFNRKLAKKEKSSFLEQRAKKCNELFKLFDKIEDDKFINKENK